MLEILLSGLIYAICVFTGGVFIGLAIDNLKRKKYILFGVNVMSASLMMLTMIQWKFQ